MENMIRAMLLALSIGIAVFPFPQATLQAKEPEKYLRIGAVLGLSGDAAYQSESIRKGAELARSTLEKQGWQVKITYEDDQTNSAKTVTAVKSLLARGYKFFLGPTWSFQVKAAEPIIRNAGAIAFCPAGSSAINGVASPHVFNMSPKRSAQQPILIDWLASQKFKRVFLFTPNGDWGEVHRELFRSAADKLNLKVYGDERFDYGIDATAIKAILLRSRLKQDDLILTTGAARDMALLVKARNELRIDASILSAEAIDDAITLGLLRLDELKDGIFEIGLPVSEKFQRLYQESYGERAGAYSDRAFDAVMALAHAVSETDGSPQSISNFLLDEMLEDGMSGSVSFDQEGNINEALYRIHRMVETRFVQN